ncbi:MAG: alanine--tRNA ligase [Candidatus Marinimicrobia bacterium]|nr:alanine--tRNA ligase [Candidatus Neomarinimicrobiota bacterium]
MKSSKQIRNEFLEFFKGKGHEIVKSSPVIPQNDPTLLFTNAGMNQFKTIFLNLEKPKYKRVANAQKCIRVSGKHNDLEEVGKDTYHHTFFEMLGNWSFGDYYKREAIQWAWELVTEVWNLDKKRLWATVYKGDEEAERLWKEVTDISPERVLRFGEKDNFWEMGETGPCGPCSEIHYYIGDMPESQSAEKINSGDPEYIEIWNLVFIQYNRVEDGLLTPLPMKHIDTGAGLERIVAIIQGKKSNYDTDLFKPLIDAIEDITGVKYNEENGVSHRVISDHVRMLSFAIADGGLPSNEGRGYVIRRILRRAARFGRIIGMHQPFIYRLVDILADIMGDVYPEVRERTDHIKRVIKYEEELFNEALDRGLNLFTSIVEKTKSSGGKIINGEDVFKLYDTYGFPVDLTKLMAEEEGLTIDENGFNKMLEEQRERGRAYSSFQDKYDMKKIDWVYVSGVADSEFIGYENIECEAQIVRYHFSGDTAYLVLDKTPFYPESGGQVGDKGVIEGKGFIIEVNDTKKANDSIIHIGKLKQGERKIDDNKVIAKVNKELRDATKRNHTATHLLHRALIITLGEHVHQAGSLVEPERLRFDFTHYEKLTDEQIEKIEDIVNRIILENRKVIKTYKKFDEAKKDDVIALFGEKYDEIVRVVEVEGFSKELCGGTHVDYTGEVGYFKILSETSVAAGVRRIEAVTGMESVKVSRTYSKIIKSLEEKFGISHKELIKRVEKLIEENKALKKRGIGLINTDDLKIKEVDKQNLGELTVVSKYFYELDERMLMEIADKIREENRNCIGILGTIIDGKPKAVVTITDDVISKYKIKAGDIAKEIGSIMGGGGGGKSHIATAGGREPSLIHKALKKSIDIIREVLDKN